MPGGSALSLQRLRGPDPEGQEQVPIGTEEGGGWAAGACDSLASLGCS